MNKFQFLQKLEIIINSFVISLISSFVRVIFHRSGSWAQTCLMFFGGIIFGTLVGYLIDGVKALESFDKILIAASAIAAKEIIEFVIKGTPTLLKKFVNKKLGTDESGDADDPTTDK